ncbi:MAG: DNA recombination protein RmuC, partial [Bacteroidota bacterium]
QKISQEANNLTNALKGDNKKQGNWGEVILERVLERSGLVKGQEYVTQFSTENVDGQKIQPDVIVHLPDDKHIIIDAKVSLVHYDQYVNASEEAEKALALKAHLASLRNHIKGLGDKNYQTAANLSTPDFVLLFVPIEASFSVAIQTDLDLFGYAWDRKVVLVSPTTLLATLRTISSIWKQERQSKNVQQIAKEGGLLYDKFVGFLEDMETIQKGLERSQSAYDAAMNKLQSGNGNLIGKAVKLRKLGAKTNKDIPEHLIEDNDQLPQNTHA